DPSPIDARSNLPKAIHTSRKPDAIFKDQTDDFIGRGPYLAISRPPVNPWPQPIIVRSPLAAPTGGVGRLICPSATLA
ncbi:hypothetical protein, partial [Teichococcus wenyumeiae]|uniref:hypothetical protein n=1 Tax=Teichococcus wenyumeiae TaxID=2478470 RepID=UPI001F38D5DC